MNETQKMPSKDNAGEFVLLSPALDENCLESAACGVQCDCNAKW